MENRDEHLWRIAKKRAGFKKHLASYIIVNGFLWLMWYFTQGNAELLGNDPDLQELREMNFPWPIWSTLGWGIGLAFNFYGAYLGDKETDVMKEYQKLKDKEGR